MKRVIFSIVLVLLFAFPVFAGDVLVDVGAGFLGSMNSEVVMLRYQAKSAQFLGFDSYWEGLALAWNGRASNEALGIAKTIRFKKNYQFAVGGLYVNNPSTENLGTPGQFFFRLGYDITPKVSIALIHISNGKAIFHWNDNHNNGENFLTLSTVLF